MKYLIIVAFLIISVLAFNIGTFKTQKTQTPPYEESKSRFLFDLAAIAHCRN